MANFKIMTTKIYSRLDPTKLLHMIVREIAPGRSNLCPEEQFLQAAGLRLNQGVTFKAHRHIPKPASFIMPEESWCVIKGVVLFMTYDTDGSHLRDVVVEAGQLTFTFNGGGHNYEIWQDDTVVIEYKSSPYLGVEADKVFI